MRAIHVSQCGVFLNDHSLLKGRIIGKRVVVNGFHLFRLAPTFDNGYIVIPSDEVYVHN